MPGSATDPAFVHLLDVEPELASRLREDDRAEARERLRLRLTVVPEGSWTLAADARHGRPFGLIVIDGVLLQEVKIAGRSALQILGPGDVVLPERTLSEALDVDLRWTAAVATRVAVLDDRLQRPFAMWPGLAVGLVERAGRQLSRVAIQTAIAQLPRVEERLEATFWDLADRWGHVTPSGIHIPLQLTHEVLARLVGGRRPTITLALRELAENGIVTRRPDRTWMLVAREPTLARNPSADTAPPLVALGTGAGGMPGEAPAASWTEPAGRHLLDTARRMRGEHADQVRDVTSSLERYEDIRRRSRALRARVEQDRAARMAARLSGERTERIA